MAGVGALVVLLTLGSLKIQKELNEKGLHTYLLVSRGRGCSPVLNIEMNSNKGSSKQNRSSFSLLALRNGGTRTTRGIGRFQRVFSLQPVKRSVS